MIRSIWNRLVTRVAREVSQSIGLDGLHRQIENLARAQADVGSTKAVSRRLGARALELLRLLSPEDPLDAEFVRVGGSEDGGYVVVASLLGGNIAYSIGTGPDVSWDVAMADRGYEVYQYDHTVEAPPESRSGFHFFRVGLAASPGERLLTLPQMLADNGHSDAGGMCLKIDIEGSEWSVLSALRPDDLSGFDQIAIELHEIDRVDDDLLFFRMLRGLRTLREAFVPVHVHGNNWRDFVIVGGVAVPPVVEVTYVRRGLIETGPCRRLFPTELDRPNHADRADLFLGSFQFPASG